MACFVSRMSINYCPVMANIQLLSVASPLLLRCVVVSLELRAKIEI